MNPRAKERYGRLFSQIRKPANTENTAECTNLWLFLSIMFLYAVICIYLVGFFVKTFNDFFSVVATLGLILSLPIVALYAADKTSKRCSDA